MTLFPSLQELLEQATSFSGLEPEQGGQMLCIVNGTMAGLSGGALGYVFGFGNLKLLLFASHRKVSSIRAAFRESVTGHVFMSKFRRWKAHQAQGI